MTEHSKAGESEGEKKERGEERRREGGKRGGKSSTMGKLEFTACSATSPEVAAEKVTVREM